MGKLVGIARAAVLRAPLEELESAWVDRDHGIAGDARGSKRDRQVTIVFRESWDAACAELAADVPWTARRANLLVEGVPTPRPPARIAIGDVVLQVTRETDPCMLMERAHAGLKKALTPDWRGGVCCNVIRGGTITLGDRVAVTEGEPS
jgi:MOSC domain-containing protein YiiM